MYIPFFHSHYGLGGSPFPALFERLMEEPPAACGIVDRTFFGLAEFLKYCRAYGIKPIIGTRLALPGGRSKADVYLFVKNKIGYENLCAVLTAVAFGSFDLELLKTSGAGLVLASNRVPALEELKPFFDDVYYSLAPFQPWCGHAFSPLAVGEAFYVNAEEKIVYRLMAAIKGNTCESNAGRLLSRREFAAAYACCPRALANNRALAEICDYVPGNDRWVFPHVPEDLLEIIKPRLGSLTAGQRKRAEYEYRIITRTGFAPYFLLVYRLKEYARKMKIGMNVRGSAAASFILYLLGLSVVDPLGYNLPFERFLNPERTEPPDIDVDVEFDQRERLIGEIYRRFGNERVAHIAVINRFQRRARFRNTARAYGISPFELKNIADHNGEYLVRKVRGIAERIDGFPHYFSCHPSGIVIAPRPITEYAPLAPSPAGQIVHFDKDGIGITGLVKIDILGVRGFPALYLEKSAIDLGDPQVFKFIGDGKTLGCFQIESPAVRHMIRNIRPKKIIDIANGIAIIRPGPAQGGMKERFYRRLRGEEKVDYPHPSLAPVLEDTLGIPVYQEQIIQIAQRFANFSAGEGDLLRRNMTKDRDPRRMKEIEDLFFARAGELGHGRREAETVWDRIAAFSSFGFNKAHSTTYATLAYLSAFQKFYRPEDFFCRVINNQGGYYPTHAYINDARRWGIRILGPDVNRSAAGFTVEPRPARGSLRAGLASIKNLSMATIERILRYRPFPAPERFFHRVRPDIDEGTALIKSGALDGLGEPWPKMYYLLLRDSSLRSRTFSKYGGTVSDDRRSRSDPVLLSDKIPDLPDFDDRTKLREQFKTIGFFPACHPLEFLHPERTNRIRDAREGGAIDVVGLVITRRIVVTKTNRRMSFLTIDDETGIIEVVVFPDCHRPGLTGPIVRVSGLIKDQNLIARRCRPLSA